MKIDFQKEVIKREKELIKTIQKFVRINSELTTFDPERVGAPFGEGIKEALDFMLDLGRKDGFNVENVSGYAGHIEYGTSEEYIGLMGHVDVVPAGSGWTYPAYNGEIHNNKIYGRGTEDDKGPTIAAYFAMKILKDLNVPLSKRIKLVLGADEESGWRCVNEYFKVYPEQPVAGFIPDADFPLIYAEKGIARIVLRGNVNDRRIINLVGGHRDNMVPDYASVTLPSSQIFQRDFLEHTKKNSLLGTSSRDGGHTTYTLPGISAHGSTPELGENAIDKIFYLLESLGIENNLTQLYHAVLISDTRGEKLDINYENDEMGPLTLNVGTIKTADNKFEIELNVRYPQGVILENIMEIIKGKLIFYDVSIDVEKHQALLYSDPNSHLVTTLMDVYKKHTGEYDSKPITIGGGTYARAMKNTLAFGPHFPDKPSYIHQKDEYIDIDDLVKATAIYAEALYELAK